MEGQSVDEARRFKPDRLVGELVTDDRGDPMTSPTDVDVVLGGPTSREGDVFGLNTSGPHDKDSMPNQKVDGRTPMPSSSASHTDAEVLLLPMLSGVCRTDDTDVLMIPSSSSGTRCVVDIIVITPREASSSSSSSDLRDSSDDEDTYLEVEQIKKTRKAKNKAKAKVCPDPPGSSLSDEKSLRRLRKNCGISEDIVLVAPTPADRADAPPAGYMTLFENYFDQCLLWFPLPRFLMSYLTVHGVYLAQINPRGIRHLLGIYVLSRECGVDISTENLSYLTDFRTRGLSEELKHSVTNSSGMALIAGFPSKDDHFEYRFFFAEISERTVEADCIDLVKARWERRVKPTLPGVSKEFLAAMHKELSSGNDIWRRSFSRKGIERALSAEILPGKILGRGGEVAEFRKLSAERARISSGKGKGVDRMTSSKRQRVDSHPAAAAGGHASASRVGGLLREKASELSLFFDRLVSEHDEYTRSRDSELTVAKEANAVLQSMLNDTVERKDALECEGEAAQLRGELSSASDLQRSRIEDAVAEVKDEMARGFSERTSEVAGLLAEIGGKAQNDMLNLTEIDANLEFIGLLQGSEPPDLSTEVKSLHGRRHPIYDAHDVFADLLASVRKVLEISGTPTGAAEASVAAAADDDEGSDEDDSEATDDDGVAADLSSFLFFLVFQT
ncbi:hypothetical protein AALP_AA6G287300 [Arabis alpina]|uniref:Uncharacterized protein n=1 Tax=Arabis alpina TaxID=50452 RepID=A0A087GSC5_ARAAL|nr:hypothetical protein AALP_AA6G287300 [Arabis alpina]